MIGTLNTESKDVTIIGAGISGLLAAYSLDQAGYRVTLLEEKHRAGGLIRTIKTDYGLSESAAHSVLATDAVRRLFSELQLPLHPVRKESRARFIYRNRRMRKVPLRIHELLATFFRAYFVLADPKKDPARLTVSEWSSRFLGKPALRYLFTPFVRGIYGSDPDLVSVGAAFPMLAVPHGHSLLSYLISKLIRRRRPVNKGPAGARAKAGPRVMSAPEGGMGALVTALEAHLEARLGDRFRKGVPVEKLPSSANLILSVPAGRAAGLLESVDPALAQALVRVKYTAMVSATAFIDSSLFPGARPIRGVGVLNPEGENRESLGILFNSSSFPGRVNDETKAASFTVMLGGSSRPDLIGQTDDAIRSIVQREVQAIFGLKAGAPLEIVIHRWPCAIPQYGNDLLDAWTAARMGWCSRPGCILFGNYSAQVSLRGLIEAAMELGRPDLAVAAGLQQS